LRELDQDFDALQASLGRVSILPENLLRAQFPMALYAIRSECQLVAQIDYNLLGRLFFGFSMDAPPAAPAMPPVSASANALRSASTGRRPLPARARAGSSAARSWTSNLS
jgi:hypothetical protein